jgi:hypothetical protein
MGLSGISGLAALTRATVLLSVVAAPIAATGSLRPETLSGWTSYVTATEQRIGRELTGGDRFLALDFGPSAAAGRAAVLGGHLWIAPMDTLDARGVEIEVPSALVHHWRGAVLLPGARLDAVLASLQTSAPAPDGQDVLQSRVLEQSPGRIKLYLRLQRTKFVTVIYNTEHTVTFVRRDANRASSVSTATKIAELESPGSPAERELTPDRDRGFLWKLNAYWRYEQVPAGVIAECESISLSREIPFLARYLVSPLVASTARESMERTLTALKRRFTRG